MIGINSSVAGHLKFQHLVCNLLGEIVYLDKSDYSCYIRKFGFLVPGNLG